MELQLDLKFKESYNCIQSVIATMAEYHNFKYDIGFLNCWNFHFKVTEDVRKRTTISDQLFIIDEIIEDVLQGFEKYQGIKLLKNIFSSKIDLISNVISALNEDKPIILILDNYWCPWSNLYEKFHMLHSFLICGVDLESKAFICTDPYLQINKINLYFDNMPDTEYICYSFMSTEKVENHDFEILIEKTNEVLGLDGKKLSFCKQIEFYAEELKFLDVVKENSLSVSIETIPLLRKLKEIENSRVNYSEALLQLKNDLGIDALNIISSRFLELSSLWGKHRYVLIKCFILSGNEMLLSQAIDIAYECATMEEDIAIEMKGIIDGFHKNL